VSSEQVHCRGVLFDVDGTLVDTTFIHALCWWQAFRQADLDAPMAVIHRSVGMGSEQLVEQVLGAGHADDVDTFATSHDALYAAYWPRLRLLPGAAELVRHCHSAGLTTVLASSASARELEVLVEVLDVGDAIDHTTNSEDADSSKPEPDIVLAALAKAGLAAEEVVFVGDAVWDVHAAAKAGVVCIGLESGGTSAAELREAGAVATYTDPADLLSHFETSLLNTSGSQGRDS
jgi:HAD superfamily hydrolase (TIGR01509 family)